MSCAAAARWLTLVCLGLFVMPSALHAQTVSLDVRATLGGSVTGDGISCGDGGLTDCSEAYAVDTLIGLQAVAGSGYDFLGWSGGCVGATPSILLLIHTSLSCVAVFHPSEGSASPPDASFGSGTLVLDFPGSTLSTTRRIYVSPEATVTKSGVGSSVQFSFSNSSGGDIVYFMVPSGPIVAGEYYDARNSFFTFPLPAMSLSGCTNPAGSFTVHEAQYDLSNTLVAFAADFEVECVSTTRPYVAGAVRWNSTRTTIVPFDGDYPRRRLVIVPSAHGQVVSPGHDCGPTGADCVEDYGVPSSVTLEAVPSAGYRFVGWAGACSGGAVTTVVVDLVRRCEPLFAAIDPAADPQDPRLTASTLFIHSQPGDVVGPGQRQILVDTIVTASMVSASELAISVNLPDNQTWQFRFAAPAGQALTTGTYEGAAGVGLSAGPGISVRRSTFSTSYVCDTPVSGRFVVHELTPPAPGVPGAAAIDFEIQCTAGAATLAGAIRYLATHADPRPFAPVAGSSVLFDISADGAADLLFQNRADGRLWLWHMSGAAHAFNEPLAPAQVGDTDWHIVGSGDANADGYADLYWQHQTSGALSVWYMRENQLLGGELLSPASVPDTNWKVRSVADVDRDGQPDLVWQHAATGHVAVWFMDGRTQRRGELIGLGPVTDLAWTIVGAGDMNGDGWPDLLWHHVGTGDLAVWYMLGETFLRGESLSPAAVPDTNWRVRGVADLDRNGTPDLLWQNLSTLDVAVWLMDGIQLRDGRLVPGPPVPSVDWVLVSPR